MVAAALGAGFLVLHQFNQAPSAPGSAPPDRAAEPSDSSAPGSAVPAGSLAPAFDAAGWLNGTPQQPDGRGPRLLVLDTWASW
jgi:hypothetical protein